MDPRFALLLACFFLSGFAALLYQTAWSRELSFVFGTSDLAVAVVLAAYMGGLALGAAAAARFAMRLRRPVLVYGLLELAIAVCALLVPWGIRGVNAVYVGLLGGSSALPESTPSAATLVQLAGAFAVLLPPTAFMGATLPLLARHAVHRDEEIASRVGVLYAVNTAGAIVGTVCAAFVLMPALGLRHTVWVGAAFNAVVFGLAVLLARSAPLESAAPAARGASPAGSFWILPAIALSGAVSFAYEVLWTRVLGQLLGASLHAFATMLASFLLGIALGSAVAARLAATRERAALGFALCQLGIAFTSYAAFAFTDRLPELVVRLGAGPGESLASAAVAVLVLLPITLCIGATFPFAVRVLAGRPEETAVATARVYAWNTVGAIVGALSAGFVLLPRLGYDGQLTVGVAASLCLAALAGLASSPRRLVLAGAAAAAGLLLVLAPPQTPWKLLTWSPLTGQASKGEIVHAAVGRTTTVMLFGQGARYLIATDGLPEARIDAKGLLPTINVAQWLGALPAMVRPDARDLLVVGLGGGVALELLPATYESIDVIELEPEVLSANRRLAPLRARDPLSDPRLRVHIGDARGSLQLAGKRYDAIVSQPSHPWTAGASHLYTREFFSLVRSRLAPDGVFVQWIGLHFVDEALLRSLLAALVEAFPHVEVFRPQPHGLLFAASQTPIEPLAGASRALESAPGDMARLGLHRLEDFAAGWALDEAGVRALAQGAPANTDDHNRLAARSGRLGDAKLEMESTRILLAPYDPLLDVSDLERSALIRRLTNTNQAGRAMDLAMASDEVDEEAGLGWLDFSAGRTGRAARHFERALELSPGDRDAESGLILSRKVDLIARPDISPIPDRDLDPRSASVIAGWRHAHVDDWEALAALDGELAGIEPGDALFRAAARLRITSLLAAKDPTAAATAQQLAETLVVQSWQPNDALLYARAALASGRPVEAAASLTRISEGLTSNARGRGVAERAWEIAQALPGEPRYEALREHLARRAGLKDQRARPETP